MTFQEAEQRLGRLRELAASLESARAAVVGCDLAELICQTGRQRELCASLLKPSDRAPTSADERWNRVLQESQRVAWQIHRLNREYGFLLARARRTVDIFCRVLANSQTTYLPPKQQRRSVR